MQETPKARAAWRDYLAMGIGRSLEALAQHYQQQTGDVPTRHTSKLKQWSTEHGWQERLRIIAEREAKEAEAKEAQRIRSIMESGVAMSHNRVAILARLARELDEHVSQPGRLIVKRHRRLRPGMSVSEAVYEEVNDKAVDVLLRVMDDAAKETGGRRQRTEISGPNGGAIQIDDVSLTDDERRRRLLAVLNPGTTPGT